MARKYTYYNPRDHKVLFETTQPNHVSRDVVDMMATTKTGFNPKLDRLNIDVKIRQV